mgnify:CR=1 FL=1
MLKPGLFTSLTLLMLTSIFVLNPAIGSTWIFYLLPGIFIALVFNPIAWGLAYLLYNAVITFVSTILATAIGGPIAGAITAGTVALAIALGFAIKVIPLAMGVIYSVIIAPLITLYLGSHFSVGILGFFFLILILYYFIFGGKYVPYIMVALIGVCIAYAALSSLAEQMFRIIIGTALLLFGAAALGIYASGKIKDTVVAFLSLWFIASIGIRAFPSLAVAQTLNDFLAALSRIPVLDVLGSGAGVILFVFLLGLFSGKPEIPDNFMKIFAFSMIIMLIGGASADKTLFPSTWNVKLPTYSDYLDAVCTATTKVAGNEDACNNLKQFIGHPEEEIGYSPQIPGGYPWAIFMGENIGGNIEQPSGGVPAPSPGERWGVNITTNPPSLDPLWSFIGSSFRFLGNMNLLFCATLVLFLAYICDMMANTTGVDIFSGIASIGRPLIPRKEEKEVEAGIKRKEREEERRKKLEELRKRAEKAREEREKKRAEREERMAKMIARELYELMRGAPSPPPAESPLKGAVETVKSRKVEIAERTYQSLVRKATFAERVAGLAKRYGSVVVTAVAYPLRVGAGAVRKISWRFRVRPYKKKGE